MRNNPERLAWLILNIAFGIFCSLSIVIPASIYWYARTYGNLWDAENASMLGIDKEGMELRVEMSDGERQIRIAFDHVLEDDDDAQSTLIDMSMKAREIIMNRAEQKRQGAG